MIGRAEIELRLRPSYLLQEDDPNTRWSASWLLTAHVPKRLRTGREIFSLTRSG